MYWSLLVTEYYLCLPPKFITTNLPMSQANMNDAFGMIVAQYLCTKTDIFVQLLNLHLVISKKDFGQDIL